MKLLDTIPIYITPWWLITIAILMIFGIIFGIIIHENNFGPIVLLTCSLIFVLCLILDSIGVCKVLDHDEYVIELTDMSATEFFKDYEPIKTFKYSNAIQVRKKVK